MPRSLTIGHPKVFGVTESSLTVAFEVLEGDRPVDAEASVRVGGRRVASTARSGSRVTRIEGLEPDTEYRVEFEIAGETTAASDPYLPAPVRTHPRPAAPEVASFATLNDVHFGESRMGGTLTADHEYGDEAPGYPVVSDDDYDLPYAEFMNADAVGEINGLGVDAAFVKGDIADSGRPEQFEAAARVFGDFAMPCHAFLGNHDYLGRHAGLDVDGYALLGQPPAPRAVTLGGWRLLLLETSVPGEHHGAFGEERIEWLEDALETSRREDAPTVLLMHHQPVPPEHAGGYPNSIGIRPADSLRFFELVGASAQVKAVLIGHTHKNRVRHYPATGAIPFAEVNNSKDYPGGFGHYRLFADGQLRQEVRRTTSERALQHARRCRDLFDGGYKRFVLGALSDRSFVVG